MKTDHDARSERENPLPNDEPLLPADVRAGESDAATPSPEAEVAPSPTEVTDYRDRWLRAEAELQNFRRRAARDLDEARRGAGERVLLEVIEILDDLDRARAAIGETAVADPLAKGIALTAQRVRDLLARHGVLPIEAVGKAFDPMVHEALLEVPAPEGVTPGQVVQEVLAGWRTAERALRAARVVVARADH